MKLYDVVWELGPSLNEGITHIEDLAVDQMIDALRNFEEYEISEKVDGANLQFGYDANGFYTSRETKGDAERVRSESDYDIAFHTTFQRAAHAALEKIVPYLIRENLLGEGDAVEIEVLFGRLPNTVPYDSDVNRIIFLRTTSGDPDLVAIRDYMKGKRTKVSLEAPYTVDGKQILSSTETYKWEFAQTPIVSGDKITKSQAKADIDEELDALEEFLSIDSGIYKFSNAEVISLPLNKRPERVAQSDWKQVKALVKSKKEELNKELFRVEGTERFGFKHRIKEILLNKLVRTISSDFGPDIKDGGWIEGVVFRHRDTGEMFKIVDKDLFTAVNNFLWKVRSEISTKAKSATTATTFAGRLLVDLATAVGHPELGTIQAKRYLRKMGSTPEEIVSNLAKDIPFAKAKMTWSDVLNTAQKELSDILDEYNAERESLKLDVQAGEITRSFEYGQDVHQRTLQVFATLHQDLAQFQRVVKLSKTPEELIMALAGQKLSEL